MIRRRRFVATGLAAGLALPAIAHAGRAINLIVAGAAGSSPDQGARAFAPFLERHLPHSTIWIVNQPGDAGLTAIKAMASADPSGATLGWISTPSLPARTVDRAGAAGLIDRLRLVGAVVKEPVAFVSSADSPLATAQDIVARSSENAEAVPLGTPPAGSPPHLAALRLQALSGTTLNIVAFPSAAAARQAALAGNVAAAALGLGDALESLRSGRLYGLGITARSRSDAFPNTPVLRESGLMLSASIYRGLAAPAALSDSVAGTLAEALRAVAADPEFRGQGDSNGFAATWVDGPSWTTQAQTERAELAQLWKDAPWPASGAG